MKLSNERLLKDAQGLSELTQKSLPVRISYAIAKNVSKIEGILKVYNKEKQKLIDKYSVKDEAGKPVVSENQQVTIQPEFIEECNKEFEELKEIENEIEIHKFNMNDLINNNVSMTPGELMMIDYMIDES